MFFSWICENFSSRLCSSISTSGSAWSSSSVGQKTKGGRDLICSPSSLADMTSYGSEKGSTGRRE